MGLADQVVIELSNGLADYLEEPSWHSQSNAARIEWEIALDAIDPARQHTVTVAFHMCMSFRWVVDSLTDPDRISDSYSRVVVIEPSEWLGELEKTRPHSALRHEVRHFALYLDDVGVFECLAREVTLTVTPTVSNPAKE